MGPSCTAAGSDQLWLQGGLGPAGVVTILTQEEITSKGLGVPVG